MGSSTMTISFLLLSTSLLLTLKCTGVNTELWGGTCKEELNPYTFEDRGSVLFLSPQPINLNGQYTTFLQMYQLQTGHYKLRYAYRDCTPSVDLCPNNHISKWTAYTSPKSTLYEQGDTVTMARHNIDCGFKNFLGYIQLIKSADGDKYRFKYTCCQVAQSSLYYNNIYCVNRKTPHRSVDDGHVNGLAHHKVDCRGVSSYAYLSRVQLVHKLGVIYYDYRCCYIVGGTCKEELNPYTREDWGHVLFLSPQRINFSGRYTTYLQMYQLQTGHYKLRYAYRDCTPSVDLCPNKHIWKWTHYKGHGNGDMRTMMNHNIDCGIKNFLGYIQIRKNAGGDKYQFIYTCCQVAQSSPYYDKIYCFDKKTGVNWDGRGNVKWLDRHKLDCGGTGINAYLSRVRLYKYGLFKILYHYRCCDYTL